MNGKYQTILGEEVPADTLRLAFNHFNVYAKSNLAAPWIDRQIHPTEFREGLKSWGLGCRFCWWLVGGICR